MDTQSADDEPSIISSNCNRELEDEYDDGDNWIWEHFVGEAISSG